MKEKIGYVLFASAIFALVCCSRFCFFVKDIQEKVEKEKQ